MEHHRLKPMKEGYDENLFNELYKKTLPLRRKLAYEIDARKFGVEYDEILSWFDVKFIYTFNKYFDTEPTRLLGYIINSLQTYKYRVMRSSYVEKYNNGNNSIDITNLTKYDNIIIDEPNHESKELFLNLALSFMKDRLSDDALLVLQLEMNIPEFITKQMEEYGLKPKAKIPHHIIADYLGLGNSEGVIKYVASLRKDIRAVITEATEYFQSNRQLYPSFN